MFNHLGTWPYEMRERDKEIGERDMGTAQDGGRQRDRDYAIEGHMETEESVGSETDIVLEVVQEGDADNGQEDANTQRGRKRQRNVENWKKNKRKRLRNSGQSYMNSHGIQVPGRRMREKNCASCRYKCNKNFPEEVREKIFKYFWEMGDAARQKDFIVNHVVKREKRNREKISRRNNTFEHYLTSDGRQIRVCKDFFLKTLDVSEKFARSAGGHSSSELGITPPSKKGRHAPPNKVPESSKDKIREHINSFPKLESHYSRKDTNKLYLEGSLNLPKMYALYQEKCEQEWKIKPEKQSLYRTVFDNEFNLAFHTPKKDACKYCEWYQRLEDSEKTNHKDEYDAHQLRKTQAREQKENDKNKAKEHESYKAVTFDLEQVLTTPWSNVSSLYYSRKLSTYNLTVYELGSKDVECYMWHEGEGCRGSSEISTCVYKYLKELSPHVKHVVLYSDTCGGQNRNAAFSTMCLHAVSSLPLSTIDHKYMESGHSQMECDSVHAAVETARRKVSIYSPDGYYTLVRMARKNDPYSVHELGHKDFLDFKSLSNHILKNRTKDGEGQAVHWQKIKWFRYMKEEQKTIFFKYDFTAPTFRKMTVAKQATRGSRGTRTTQPSSMYESPPGISALKKKDLLTLCTNGSIPHYYAEFYNTLTVGSE
ncbi:hypothetical protein ACEWY4_017643 [Coilia grayii]|uniref:Uncharacterized protein n=1 Tax=Coilia grayii TaxID=363190 RepID=A0ABD1JHF2_9TELE